MSPASIICQAQADGVRLALTAAGSIKASGDGAAIERWLAVLSVNKAALVALLRPLAGQGRRRDEPGGQFEAKHRTRFKRGRENRTNFGRCRHQQRQQARREPLDDYSERDGLGDWCALAG